jgi:hypothetical protein
MGFLKYEEQDDFTTAARYLQPAPDGNADLVQRAEEMQKLRARFNAEVALLSDDPKGTVEAGLPLGEVRAGDLTIGGTRADVILVRVDDPESGKIWLVSQETVARIPQLYALLQSEKPGAVERLIPAALTGHRLLGMSLAQWLGWLLSIPISWLLAWPLGYLFTAPSRVWHKLRRIPFRAVWDTPIEVPLRCIIAILAHSVFVYLLHPPLLYRAFYFRFMAALLAACAAWLVSRIARTCMLPNKVQIAEWIEDYGEDSDFVRARVRGLPPSAGDLQFIDSERVWEAQRRQALFLVDDPLICGVDVARGGGDWNVIRFRKGYDARTIPAQRIPGEQTRDSTFLVSKLSEVLADQRPGHKVAHMFVDAAFGGPVVNRLQQLGFANVSEINFGRDGARARRL